MARTCKNACNTGPRDPEEWRDVPGFNGAYQASTYGRVRKVDQETGKCRILQGSDQSKWRSKRATSTLVQMRLPDGRMVRRALLTLVAITFFDVPEGSCPVHKSSMHSDNSVDNIMILPQCELGRRFGARGNRMVVAKIAPNGDVLEFYSSARAAARANFLDVKSVTNRCNRTVKNDFRYGCSFRWAQSRCNK